jgi:hypothetical protein
MIKKFTLVALLTVTTPALAQSIASPAPTIKQGVVQQQSDFAPSAEYVVCFERCNEFTPKVLQTSSAQIAPVAKPSYSVAAPSVSPSDQPKAARKISNKKTYRNAKTKLRSSKVCPWSR